MKINKNEFNEINEYSFIIENEDIKNLIIQEYEKFLNTNKIDDNPLIIKYKGHYVHIQINKKDFIDIAIEKTKKFISALINFKNNNDIKLNMM